jgi:hypothetical protein
MFGSPSAHAPIRREHATFDTFDSSMEGGTSPRVPDELKLEVYKTALATRNFEIQLFWQRSNYFLVLNTAVAIGFFSRVQHDRYAFGLSLIGIAVSFLWVRINLGSKFWQSRWEHRLEIAEDDLQPGLDLFSAGKDVLRADARKSLEAWGNQGWLMRAYTEAVLRKPSVSKTMTLLSLLFVLVWIAAACFSGHAAFSCNPPPAAKTAPGRTAGC